MGLRISKAGFRLLRVVVLILVLAVFMMTTHPVQVPALMLIVPFLLLFVIIYYVALEIVRYLQPDSDAEKGTSVVYRPRLFAALVAGFPVLLLVLQSIMELNRWDVIIASAIFLLAYVFVARGLFVSRRI